MCGTDFAIARRCRRQTAGCAAGWRALSEGGLATTHVSAGAADCAVIVTRARLHSKTGFELLGLERPPEPVLEFLAAKRAHLPHGSFWLLSSCSLAVCPFSKRANLMFGSVMCRTGTGVDLSTSSMYKPLSPIDTQRARIRRWVQSRCCSAQASGNCGE